ncbi:hypothetical protein CBR_g3313 [Chara braunii]|uniref:Glutamine cyclotransferase n=1 Tax=Chara braunii TaxID=69332 RepID=A0A388KFN2_CHABU|nr:hypothetical protein CBR_g3311 [Chara braunii]GBG68773.1 hypothetical protein CBR_g3313 [Chara braunii]|eukprot:GBG68771.1 hypothetical protein CBR_g3311 [Chara braunii]
MMMPIAIMMMVTMATTEMTTVALSTDKMSSGLGGGAASATVTTKNACHPIRYLSSRADPPLVYTYEVVSKWKHDPNAFTQGLVYDYAGDCLYESTGMYGESSIRQVEIETGKVQKIRRLAHDHFGEGLTLFQGKLYQMLWLTNAILAYSKQSLKKLGVQMSPMKDGWGLTDDGNTLIGSDGSSTITFFDPITFKEVRRVAVHDDDMEVSSLNELEYVKGEIWANVWMKHCIARISPSDGRVLGWIILKGLAQQVEYDRRARRSMDVLNGIAWDGQRERLFVTGKYWPTLFQLKIGIAAWAEAAATVEEARKQCIPTVAERRRYGLS